MRFTFRLYLSDSEDVIILRIFQEEFTHNLIGFREVKLETCWCPTGAPIQSNQIFQDTTAINGNASYEGAEALPQIGHYVFFAFIFLDTRWTRISSRDNVISALANFPVMLDHQLASFKTELHSRWRYAKIMRWYPYTCKYLKDKNGVAAETTEEASVSTVPADKEIRKNLCPQTPSLIAQLKRSAGSLSDVRSLIPCSVEWNDDGQRNSL